MAVPCVWVSTRAKSTTDATDGLLLDITAEPILLLPEVKSSIDPALTLMVALFSISLNETERTLLDLFLLHC